MALDQGKVVKTYWNKKSKNYKYNNVDALLDQNRNWK